MYKTLCYQISFKNINNTRFWLGLSLEFGLGLGPELEAELELELIYVRLWTE